jgi:hypothetical protein
MFDFDQAYAAGTDDIAGFVEYGIEDTYKKLDAVNRFLAVVNKDMVTHTKEVGLPKMLQKWNDDVWEPWQEFFRSTQGLTNKASLLRDSTYRRAEAYRQLGLRYRENLVAKERTGTQVTPTVIPPPIKKPDGTPAIPGKPIGVSLPPKKAEGGIPWKWILTGGAILGAGYVAYKMWPARRAAGMLTAPEEQVTNPPPWVQDADIWESAKLAVSPYKPRYHNPDAVITHVYKQMGGRIG